jgi:hypothetical protein
MTRRPSSSSRWAMRSEICSQLSNPSILRRHRLRKSASQRCATSILNRWCWLATARRSHIIQPDWFRNSGEIPLAFQRLGSLRARRRRLCEPSTVSTAARDIPASTSSAPPTIPESLRRRRVRHHGRGTTSCTGWRARLSGEWIGTKQGVWTGRLRTTGAPRASTATTCCLPRDFALTSRCL